MLMWKYEQQKSGNERGPTIADQRTCFMPMYGQYCRRRGLNQPGEPAAREAPMIRRKTINY